MVKPTLEKSLNDIYTMMTPLMLRRLTADDDFINSLLFSRLTFFEESYQERIEMLRIYSIGVMDVANCSLDNYPLTNHCKLL